MKYILIQKHIVSISDDLSTWEELEDKGREVTVEKAVKTNGTHTFYFQDEAENVKDVSITATKIDDKSPIANISVSKTNNIVTIDASRSEDKETSISKYYYSKDGVEFIESTSNTYSYTDNVIKYGIATEAITSIFDFDIYVKVEDEVGNVSEVKKINYKREDSSLLYDETVDNNLRYVGSKPNNYVSFNNELWRIIGVMNSIDDGTGKKEKRIKLIRNESLGDYSWDSSVSTINNGQGINEWSQSDIKNLLNNLYLNRNYGICYIGINNTSANCDFRQIGIANSSKILFGNAVWNLGTNDLEKYFYYNMTIPIMYNLEKSTNIGKKCGYGPNCNDNILRTTKWTGLIGLMYTSDYGYATNGEDKELRKRCLNLYTINWEPDCSTNNWLTITTKNQWTISPNPNHYVASYAWQIHSLDTGCPDLAYCSHSVRPSLYLKSNVKITSGSGSKENPFQLSV